MSTRERRQRERAKAAAGSGGLGELLSVLFEVANDGTYRGQPLMDGVFVARLCEILEAMQAAGDAAGGSDAESVAFVIKRYLPLPRPDVPADDASRQPYVYCETAVTAYLASPRFAAFRSVKRCSAGDCRRWFLQQHARAAYCTSACRNRRRPRT